MTLEEKAQEYALKALEEQIVAVKQAYIDGYNAAKAKYNHEPIVDENGIKWYDMDLPSGNLWSEPLKEVFKYKDIEEVIYTERCYNEVKDLSIPTKNDIEEFLYYTQQLFFTNTSKYNSQNGVCYTLLNSLKFWYKGEAVHFNACIFDYALKTTECFMGEKKNVILIKRKN